MHPALQRALAPVLRDVAASGFAFPRIEEGEFDRVGGTASAMLFSPDGSGSGVVIDIGEPAWMQIARVADQVQEWVIEELWSHSTNWPVCPAHPLTHPMVADGSAAVAYWRCPAGSKLAIEIGKLKDGGSPA